MSVAVYFGSDFTQRIAGFNGVSGRRAGRSAIGVLFEKFADNLADRFAFAGGSIEGSLKNGVFDIYLHIS